MHASSGWRAELEQLLKDGYERNLAYFRRVTKGNAHDSEELTQELSARALARLGQFKGTGPLLNWVSVIRRRLAQDYGRSRSRPVQRRDLAEVPPPDGPRGPAEIAETKLTLEEILKSLEPVERELLELYHGTGFTYAEIANQKDIPKSEVERIVRSAFQKCRDRAGSELHAAVPATERGSQEVDPRPRFKALLERKPKVLSQEAAGDRLGVSQETISKWKTYGVPARRWEDVWQVILKLEQRKP